jgi:hypothetical protein
LLTCLYFSGLLTPLFCHNFVFSYYAFIHSFSDVN